MLFVLEMMYVQRICFNAKEISFNFELKLDVKDLLPQIALGIYCCRDLILFVFIFVFVFVFVFVFHQSLDCSCDLLLQMFDLFASFSSFCCFDPSIYLSNYQVSFYYHRALGGNSGLMVLFGVQIIVLLWSIDNTRRSPL